MSLQSRMCLLLLAAGLGACAQQPPANASSGGATLPRPPVSAAGQCNEDAAQFAVGKTADAKLAEEVRVRAGVKRVRMVRPGQMVTMEFDTARLTLELDANGRVLRARCG